MISLPTHLRSAVWLASILLPRAFAAELVLSELKTDLTPKPVPYSVLLPDGYKEAPKPLPLVFLLHGGGGSRDDLSRFRPFIEALWQSGKLPPIIFATPSVAERGFYMDRKDGSEKWESFLIGPFLEVLQTRFHASGNPKEHFLTGVSMGGMGTLRIGFKHPEMFGAIAALEAGIEPILHWKDMRPRDRWWRDDSLFEAAFGKPVDPDFWEANNPASIAQAAPDKLRRSGLQIYIDAADHDLFFLYEGNEFLHRVLYDQRIEHEYHLVHGADHVGKTVGPRFQEALQFFARVLNPPPPDPVVLRTRKLFIELKAKAGIHDPLDPQP